MSLIQLFAARFLYVALALRILFDLGSACMAADIVPSSKDEVPVPFATWPPPTDNIEKQNIAASRGLVSRDGNTLVIRPKKGNAQEFHDWRENHEAADSSGETFRYIGGNNRYSAVYSWDGHGTDDLLIIHAVSGNSRSFAFYEETAYRNRSGTLIVGVRNDNDFRVPLRA